MANLSLFSIRVKGGTKKNLEKFFDSQSMSECFNCEYKSIKNNNYLFFNGECKWGINAKQNQSIEDDKSLDNYSIEELENCSLQDKSKIFNCEIEAFEYAEDANGIANHYRYKDGKTIIDEEIDLRNNKLIKYISDKDENGEEYDFWEVDFEKAFKLGTKNEEEIKKKEKELDTKLIDNDIKNFHIREGKLVEYNGPGGTVLIPEGVESIDEYAFYKNNNVKKIVLPSSLKEISDYCFNSMKNLEKIELPNPFIPIGEDAFDESNKSKLFIDDLLIIGNALLWCRADKEIITVPDNVEVIRERAFQYKEKLKKVILPKKVYHICENAFLNCENLEDINISNTVKYIGKSCFKNCKKLKKFELTNDTVVDYMALFNCENFKDRDNFIINNNVIVNYFGNDTNVVIPNGIVEIGEETFMNNKTIQTIEIPDSVVKIGTSTFRNCENLKEINLPNNISLLGQKCFNNSGISKVTISDSLVEIPTGCFESCNNLFEIVLPNNIKNLGYRAFCGCHQLKNITLSNNLELIGNSCFYGCSSLDNVIIPSSVKKIDEYAFQNCISLSNIKMNKEKIEIAENVFDVTKIYEKINDINSINDDKKQNSNDQNRITVYVDDKFIERLVPNSNFISEINMLSKIKYNIDVEVISMPLSLYVTHNNDSINFIDYVRDEMKTNIYINDEFSINANNISVKKAQSQEQIVFLLSIAYNVFKNIEDNNDKISLDELIDKENKGVFLELNNDGNFSSKVIENEKLPDLVCVNIFGEYVKARPYEEDIVDNYLDDITDKIVKDLNYDNKKENEEEIDNNIEKVKEKSDNELKESIIYALIEYDKPLRISDFQEYNEDLNNISVDKLKELLNNLIKDGKIFVIHNGENSFYGINE